MATDQPEIAPELRLTSYEQAIALQTRLVRRGILSQARVHEIDQADETPYDSVWLHCTCGEWIRFKVEDSERGESLYTSHVRTELALAVAA